MRFLFAIIMVCVVCFSLSLKVQAKDNAKTEIFLSISTDMDTEIRQTYEVIGIEEYQPIFEFQKEILVCTQNYKFHNLKISRKKQILFSC